MPKLAAKTAKEVETSEPIQGGFEPLRPGKYVATLEEVEARVGQDSGNPYWNVVFHEIHNLDGEKQPGKQFLTLMLPADPKNKPKDLSEADDKKWETARRMAKGRMKAFFDAFGYETDSDTDEMLGERCIIRLNIETIKKGEKAGQQTNRVVGTLELGEDEKDIGTGGSEDSSDF